MCGLCRTSGQRLVIVIFVDVSVWNICSRASDILLNVRQ